MSLKCASSPILLLVLCLLSLVSGCGGGSGGQASSSELDISSRYGQKETVDADASPSAEGNSELVRLDHALSYKECVTFALQHAPQVLSGKTQLKIEQLNTEDAFYNMFPLVNVNLKVSQQLSSSSSDGGTSLRVNFNSDRYDPFSAYFTYEAKKALRKIAAIQHLDEVDRLFQQIGESYLRMESKQRDIAALEENVRLYSKVVEYYSSLPENQAEKPLELLQAKAEVKNRALEAKRERIALKRLKIQLRLLIGADLDQKVEFDVDGAVKQILGSFDPSSMTIAEAQKASRELQVLGLMQECSKYRVSVAWAKYIPVFNLGLTTPDPVSSDKKKEYYGIFGFTTPILDWGERSREVDRAMLTQKVDALDAQNTRREFDVQYIQARQDFELYAAEDEYAFSNDELTVLQYKKNKILYESGIVALPKLLESYADTYNSKIELNKIHLLRNIVYLGLKRMSGKLFNELIGEVDYDVQ